MKIKMAVACFAFICSSVMADIAVNWYSTHPVYADEIGGAFIPAGSLAQLVWSPDSPTGAQVAWSGTDWLAGSTEYILRKIATPGAGIIPNDGYGDRYSNADVGGADILSGWFYTRIFAASESDISLHTPYLQVGVEDPDLVEFNPLEPWTVYTYSVLAVSSVLVTEQGLQVIPEPGTLSLMGLAAVSFYALRKKKFR